MVKILTIFVILAIVQQSHQAYLAPRQTVAAPAWDRRWGGWPMDWNHDGIIDWRDGWGWNNGIGGDWDLSDGVIESWTEGTVVPSYYGYRGNWENTYYQPAVARRLGAKSDASSILKSNQIKKNASKFLGDHFKFYYMLSKYICYIKQKEPTDLEMFKMFDRNKKGKISALDIQTVLNQMGEYIPIEEIEKKIEEAGGEDGQLTYEQFKEAMANGL